MDHRGIPENVRNFLSDAIESVSQLEILFTILKSKDRKWSADEICKELRTHPSATLRQMTQLHEKGVLKKESEGIFSYQPHSNELDETVTKLFHLYGERPVAIISYLYDKPTDRLKGFADAFKLKKD